MSGRSASPDEHAAGRPVAVVTGGNRGIGREVCRQLAARGHTVVLGARDTVKGEEAAASLAGTGAITACAFDVDGDESVRDAADFVRRRFGRCDVLINNAATLYDTWEGVLDAELNTVRAALETNTFGAWRTCQAFAPLLRIAGPGGRVVNVSSEAGSLTGMRTARTPAYAVSKAALNALTRLVAADLRAAGVLVNAVCPGWVATDMGGAGGRSVAEGAAGIVWAATLPEGGPTGGFFRDGTELPW